MKKFSNNAHTIILGDVLEGVRAIESSSVDLIFADPPYNIGKNFDGIEDRMGQEEYFEWCFNWIMECHRVLKPAGSFYLMAATQNMPRIDIFCQSLFAIMSRIVWSYDSSGVQAKKFFGSLYEPILFMVKDMKRYTFNSHDILVEARTGAIRRLIDYRKNPPRPYNNTKVPGNVWHFPRVRFKMTEYQKHPSQKPEALLERIIRASSNENEVVFDPFGGSFTTAAVAQRLGRRSISIECNPKYVQAGMARISLSDSHKNAGS